MTNVLITGGAGFIGSHLTDRLLDRGDTVLVDRQLRDRRAATRLPAEHEQAARSSRTRSPTTPSSTRSSPSFGPEVVVHAAASYKDPEALGRGQPDERGRHARTSSAPRRRPASSRFVYFQTALCYGLHPQEQPITLSHPLDPKDSSYAISKTAGECYVRLSGLDWISFRLANVYGPRNLSGPLPTFYQRLSEEKPCFVMDTRRDFVFVDDLVEVAMKAVDGGGRAASTTSRRAPTSRSRSSSTRRSTAMGIELDGRRRGPAAQRGRRAVDPARPVEDGARLRLGSADAARARASRRRSTTTASTASRRRSRT